MDTQKLSASGIADFLRSPAYYYWRHVYSMQPGTVGIIPVDLSVTRFDHDLIFGTVWAEFVDRFYRGSSEAANQATLLSRWREETSAWLDGKTADGLERSLVALSGEYYDRFSPDDGVRRDSELWVEDEHFCGRLDGLSADGVIHELKTTKHAQNLTAQLDKYRRSIQVKLYAVLTGATGVRIELAFKDTPQHIVRDGVWPITGGDRALWAGQLNNLHYVVAGHDPAMMLMCHPAGCTITSGRYTSLCPYAELCRGNMDALAFFKPRKEL